MNLKLTGHRFHVGRYVGGIAIPFWMMQYATPLILITFTATTIILHLKLDSPIISGDEYMYFSNAREFPHNLDYPTLPRVNNILYLALGDFFWSYFSNPLYAARIIQPIMYLTIFFSLYTIARLFISRLLSILIALIGFISAMSTYSAYFMPETTYHMIFYFLFASTVWLLPRPILNSIVSGFLAALLMLTKPNGLVIAFAWMAAWLACLILPRLVRISRSASLLALLIFPAVTYVSVILVGSWCRGEFSADPFIFIGDYYRNMLLGHGQSPINWSDFATVLVGNATALGLVVGFPLVYAVIAILGARSTHGTDAKFSDVRHKPYVYFLILLIAVSTCTIGMTIIFTTKIGGTEELGGTELVRVHGRYYSFILPLYLILMFSASELFRTRSQVRSNLIASAGALGLAVVIFVQFYWRNTYQVNAYDFPEIFALSNYSGNTTTIVLIAAMAFAGIAIVPRRGPLIFGAFFATLSLASLIQTTRWQFDANRSHGVWYREALAVRDLLSPASIDSGVVIGRDYNETVVVLFGLRSFSRTIILPEHSVVDESIVGPDAKWVVLQGEYDSLLKGATIVRATDVLKFITLNNEGNTQEMLNSPQVGGAQADPPSRADEH